VVDRLQYELSVINKLSFTDYFLIVKDIVDFCRREQIPCVGRGSAADSIVSYVLGITFADPIRFNLYFERFLNPERTDAPDIDLDICWKNRDRVLQYVYQRYGADKTAMICTYNTFQSRAAVREVAKTFGLPEDEISELTRYFPYLSKADNLDQTMEKIPQLRDQPRLNSTYREILSLCKRLAGFPRHLSIHSGGVIIAPDRLTKYTALEVAGKGIVISQYDMHAIERLGLVKMDLLGVRSLTIITECLEQVRSNYKNQQESAVANEPKFNFLKNTEKLSPLDLRAIPDNDPATIRMIKSGKTLGCFQLESPLVRGVIRKMQTDSLDDTVAAVAVIRPGVGDSAIKDEYILRRGGVRPLHYSHPILEPVLKETFGMTVFQEQVMLIAQAVAGFTLAQADVLRRAISKNKDNKQLMNSMQEQFLSGARTRGIPDKKAEEIWQFLLRFTGFGFNKAHAATYGILAYQTAFLKCYFPLEFMLAVLNNPGAFYATAVYIEECRRMGIPILEPDINRSEIDFTAEGKAIRVGLAHVFELTDQSKKRIVEERKIQPFQDFYDFLQRSEVGQKEAEHLIRCGALWSLHPGEPVLLVKAQCYFKKAMNKAKTEFLTRDLNLPPYTTPQHVVAELVLLGFAVTDHPLALYKEVIPWNRMVTSSQVEANKNRRINFTGWFVMSHLQETKSGQYMKFLTLEDQLGQADVIFFPNVYAQYAEILHGLGPFTITGKVQSRLKGEANIIAEKVIRWMSPKELLSMRMTGHSRTTPSPLPQVLL
ncbi:MAG TPA: DNA polymerase III subunit alpha, partial [bacterium]